MTKKEFLDRLRASLSPLSAENIQSSLDFYSEMVDDRIETGMSEEEAVADLGSPEAVAKEIMLDMPLQKIIKNKCKRQRGWRAWEIILLVLGSPIWLSLAVAALAIVLSVYAVLWTVVVSCWAVGAALAGTGIGAFAAFAMTVGSNIAGAVVYLGVALFGLGASVPCFFGCKKLTDLAVWLSVGFIRLIKFLIIGRKGEKKE